VGREGGLAAGEQEAQAETAAAADRLGDTGSKSSTLTSMLMVSPRDESTTNSWLRWTARYSPVFLVRGRTKGGWREAAHAFAASLLLYAGHP